MPLDPCRLPPGRRTPSRDQALSCLAELGGRGASSREIARWCGLPVERVRRLLAGLGEMGIVELRSVDGRLVRWFLREVG